MTMQWMTHKVMASPNHMTTTMILNKTRCVIKTNKITLIGNLAYQKKIHGQLRYKRNIMEKDVNYKENLDEL